MPPSEVEKLFRAFAEKRKAELSRFIPDGIPIMMENKFDDAIYNYLYAYWKEHLGEYDPKKDVIPESEMNKMHPKTKNEFQFEKWLFEQYGMTSKEKTENTLMGNLNVLLEVSDVIDIAALPVGAIAVGAKLVGKKIGKKVIKEVGEELGEKAVKEVAEGTVEKTVKEVAGETVEKTMKKEAAEEAVEKTVKTEVSEGVTETTTKKEMADTAEDLSQKTVDKDDALKDSSRVKEESEPNFDINKLTRSQKKAIESAENTINDHLKESDLSAALNDLQGNPIEKPGGGYWNHAQEVRDAYPSLKRAKNTLEGSLKNPNLEPDVRNYIQSKYDTITEYMTRIEDLFAPYGGI